MGIKLVYYRDVEGQLTFASEMRGVLAADSQAPEVDPLALNLFLKYRYTPSPLTVFQGVRKLAPGTMLSVENGVCEEERWYNFTPVPFEQQPDDEEAARELLRSLQGSGRAPSAQRCSGRVFLSGGLDSGLLLALMNQHGGPWPAYTVGYGESFEDDELKDAAETASILGAKHIQVRLDRGSSSDRCRRSSPASRSRWRPRRSCRCTSSAERARQDVKVALIGQGPDELFGGYKRHIGVRYGESWRGLPRRCDASSAPRLPSCRATRR